uniref:Uncharacterized protein n=1 Tax=Helianthus annuus TaxID=4232 RepID=A0A251SUM8_HELAN
MIYSSRVPAPFITCFGQLGGFPESCIFGFSWLSFFGNGLGKSTRAAFATVKTEETCWLISGIFWIPES